MAMFMSLPLLAATTQISPLTVPGVASKLIHFERRPVESLAARFLTKDLPGNPLPGKNRYQKVGVGLYFIVPTDMNSYDKTLSEANPKYIPYSMWGSGEVPSTRY